MLLLVFLFKNPLIVLNQLLRYDFYESFTNPKIHINMSHYNPSAPPYIGILFTYKYYYVLQNKESKIEIVWLDFKLIEKPCDSSVLFTAIRDDIEKLDLDIIIHLYTRNSKIANFQYTFYKGFNHGYYELLSIDKRFAINLEIPDVTAQPLKNFTRLSANRKSYLNSISGGNGELCLIDEYNLAAFLEPKYTSGLPNGLITAIIVEIKRGGKSIGTREYPVFECYKHREYPNEPIVFIKDEKHYKTKLKILYWKFVDDAPYSMLLKFNVLKPVYDYVYNLNKINTKYNKVFLIRLISDSKKCPDGSTVYYDLSEKKVIYYAYIIKFSNSSIGVENSERLFRDPQNLCDIMEQ